MLALISLALNADQQSNANKSSENLSFFIFSSPSLSAENLGEVAHGTC